MMPNPYILLAVLLIWLASLAGVGVWQNHSGHTAERVVWQARETTELASANMKLHALEESYRQQEQQHATNLNAIAVNYQKELDDANAKTDDLVRRARAGAFRLRDPGTSTHAAGGGQLPETATRAGGLDDTGDRGLSTDAAGFLLGLASRCDRVSRKLSACQSIVRSDRDR